MRVRLKALQLHMRIVACSQPRQTGGTATLQQMATVSTTPTADRNSYMSKVSGQHYAGYYGELDFKAISQGLAVKRVRQHVNPLKRELQVPAPPPDWQTAYADPTLPLVLDIGCGYGRFAIALASALRHHNILGCDIRQALIERGNSWVGKVEEARGRVCFHMANATVSCDSILQDYPGKLDLVTIQYPDPQFKKRHQKRRIVQPQLVDAILRQLQPGGRLLLQSDVKEVANAMRAEFEARGQEVLQPASQHQQAGAVTMEADDEALVAAGSSAWAAAGWLRENPLGVPTERELHTLEQNLPVYRLLLVKRQHADGQQTPADDSQQ